MPEETTQASQPTPRLIKEIHIEFTPEELKVLDRVRQWQEDSAKSKVPLGGDWESFRRSQGK